MLCKLKTVQWESFVYFIYMNLLVRGFKKNLIDANKSLITVGYQHKTHKIYSNSLSYLLIFLTIVLIVAKSGRSAGSSDQHFTIRLLMSQHVSLMSSTIGLKGWLGYTGLLQTSWMISVEKLKKISETICGGFHQKVFVERTRSFFISKFNLFVTFQNFCFESCPRKSE